MSNEIKVPERSESVYPVTLDDLKQHLLYGVNKPSFGHTDMLTLLKWLSGLINVNGYLSLPVNEFVFRLHIIGEITHVEGQFNLVLESLRIFESYPHIFTNQVLTRLLTRVFSLFVLSFGEQKKEKGGRKISLA